MDRRREPRFDSRAPARICALSGEEQSAEGLLLNISGRGARIQVSQPFAVNIPVRIDVGEKLLLGDVCYCRQEREGYSLGVALSHSILEMTNLGGLMECLLHHPLAEAAQSHAAPSHSFPSNSAPSDSLGGVGSSGVKTNKGEPFTEKRR